MKLNEEFLKLLEAVCQFRLPQRNELTNLAPKTTRDPNNLYPKKSQIEAQKAKVLTFKFILPGANPLKAFHKVALQFFRNG